MSDENVLGREPIELVEIVLPRCANTYGVAPCTATGAEGAECFNCRATCQAPGGYRDTPDRHLTADLTLAQGDTVAESDITRTASVFAGFEVRFAGSSPEGIIWEQGSSANGVYLGVEGDQLVFEVVSTNTATISVDVAPFVGKTTYLYAEIEFTASTTCTLNLWAFDPVELTLSLLGTDTIAPGPAWADTDGGAIGAAGGSTVGGNARPDVDWSGGIAVARIYDSASAPSDMSDNFSASLWLGRGVKGEPTDEKYILPCLNDLGTIGTRINLSAADDNYQPLGRRATLSFTVSDFAHSDITQDPYVATRPYDPRERSTFWRKWLARQKFGKVGALVRVYDGYAGQPLSAYKTRGYILDKTSRVEDGVEFHCRDVLSRTEFRKAQVPAASSGVLSADLTDDATSFTAAGDVTADYPTTGTVRINDEIMIYGSISAGGDPLETTFSGLTRGTDGSSPQAHEAGDLVQVCRRYTAASITDVISDWLFTDAKIEGQFVNSSEIAEEVTAYLDAYFLTTLLTEPVGVDTLLGRLSEECSFYMFWDERSQQIRLKAIRAVGADDIVATWTEGDNIVSDTFRVSERPKERLNVVTFYYNPIDFAGDLNKATNFKNGLKVINGTTSLPEQYGNLVQSREIFSIFLTTEALANQTSSRLSLRYADVPFYADFYVDAKDRAVWVGDVVRIRHPLIVRPNGQLSTRRWLVIEAEEVDPGHLVRYVCSDITLDGTIYVITENGIGTYTEDLFEDGNAFIADNDGLNPDGTTGTTIS